MIKVLRVVTSMNPKHGGVVEAINQSAMLFNNNNYKMDVLCFDEPNDDWVISQNMYDIFTIGRHKTGYAYNKNYLNWLKLHSSNYDLIILDGLWQFISVGGYILKSLDIPYCVFTHGMMDPYFNKDKLKYIKKLPFWFFIERNIISSAAAVIFTCHEEKLLAAKSFPLYKSTPAIATLGVKKNIQNKEILVNTFYEQFPFLQNKKFSLFLSRINEKKGIDLLLEAISNIKNIPLNFIFAIAGPGEKALIEKLKKQIRDLNIEHKVIWLGMLKGDVKWGAFHAAEHFILPSHQENFGIVVAEALSTSTPVLITNKVNIWREIDSAKAGFVSIDNAKGIEGMLEQWFSLTKEQKHLLCKNAQSCFSSYFSPESSKSDLEKIILRTIKN